MKITFKNVLKLFENAKKNDAYSIKQSLKILGIEDLNAEEEYIVLNEISKYVFEINNKHSQGNKTFDLNLDYKYYFPDFLTIGINLNKDEISWWEFDSLLDWFFRKDDSSISSIMKFRLYEKPSKNSKTQEEKEHKFRMQMKRKYALPNPQNNENNLEKMWNYVEKKAGENKV